jgi:hypothetical protein
VTEELAMDRLRSVAVVVSTALLGLPLLAKEAVVQSRWTAAPLTVDAVRAKWDQDTLLRQKSFDVEYGFSNDAENLYCLFVFNDPKYLSSIAATGMTFWVGAGGKETRSAGLRFYQKTVTADGLIAFLEGRGETLTDEKKQGFRTKQRYVLFVCDLVNKKGDTIPHPGAANGVFRSARAGHVTTYEFLIPLALLKTAAGEGQWNPLKPITLGFEWGGMTAEMRKARAAEIGDAGARASGADSDFGAFMTSEGESAAFRAPSSSLEGMRYGPKKHAFWVEIALAQPR